MDKQENDIRAPFEFIDPSLPIFSEKKDDAAFFITLEPASSAHFLPYCRSLWKHTFLHGGHRLKRYCAEQYQMRIRNKDTNAKAVSWQNVSEQGQRNLQFYYQNLGIFRRELLCGIAATLLQIPETIAFSYVANLDPIVGLHATAILAFVVAVFGGVPGTIAGAAGAVAVVMPQLTGNTGDLKDLPYSERIHHLFIAVFISGLLQLLFGFFNLSKFFAMIPRTSHIGFLNGLAIMMFLSQMTTFKVCDDSIAERKFGECEIRGDLKYMELSNPHLWTTLFTIVMTMLIMHFYSRIPKIGKLLPPTLIVALFGIGFEFGINRPLLHYNVRTIGDTSHLSGGLPRISSLHLHSVQNWSAVLECAASLAIIGIFESIMTLQAVVDLTKSRLTTNSCRKEAIAQGIGNMLCGLTQSMGGCSMIAQSTGNILNNARYRLSGIFCGITMFAVVLFASSIMELVPVACLSGILYVIIAHTFHWESLLLLFRVRITDALAIILVTVLAATVNLAVAVIAGVVWEAVVSGWNSRMQLSFHSEEVCLESYWLSLFGELHTDQVPDVSTYFSNVKVYHMKGSLMYSAIMRFRSFFQSIHQDPTIVIIDLKHCHVSDFSGSEALRELALRYRDQSKLMLIHHLSDSNTLQMLVTRSVGWKELHNATDVINSIKDQSLSQDSDEQYKAEPDYMQLKSPTIQRVSHDRIG